MEELIEEIQKKIGRNLLLYQELERQLKSLITIGQFSGRVESFKDDLLARQVGINKQTMGRLVDQYLGLNGTENVEQELGDDSISIDIRIGLDELAYENRKEMLEELVQERNDFVHHLLPKIDFKSPERCEEIARLLDKQAHKTQEEIKNIARINKRFVDIFRYLATDEAQKIIELQQIPLVELLVEASVNASDKDGWVLMNRAGNLLRSMPDTPADIRKNSKSKTLKSFMLKTTMFEFKEEATSKGGKRVFYRLNRGLL